MSRHPDTSRIALPADVALHTFVARTLREHGFKINSSKAPYPKTNGPTRTAALRSADPGRFGARVPSAVEEVTLRKSQSIRLYGGITGVTAVLMVPTLAACSSSSSGGGLTKAQASASAAASAAASRLGITTVPSLSPGVHGPNGDITAPASNAPTKTSPGGSVVFPNVSKADSEKFTRHLNKVAGVRAVTYYPQVDQLQVYFDKTATAASREKVSRYIEAHDPAAAGSPSQSPTTTSTASPSASAS